MVGFAGFAELSRVQGGEQGRKQCTVDECARDINQTARQKCCKSARTSMAATGVGQTREEAEESLPRGEAEGASREDEETPSAPPAFPSPALPSPALPAAA